jgi:N-methylhydantoinase A/oxoprolinase/acetone carboxylase beta subunit
MRAGFTPTDAMHIKGDFSGFDTEASRLAAQYLTRAIPTYEETPEDVMRLCDDVYDAVESKLYANLVRVLWQNAQPEALRDAYPESLEALLTRRWNQMRSGQEDMLALSISTPAKLVGVGAPIGIFLPPVARALGTDYAIPEHAEVANAIGAITTRVRAQVQIEVRAYYKDAAFVGYTVPCEQGTKLINDLDEAIEFARTVATRQAKDEAYARGARGELDCTFTTQSNVSHAFGLAIHFSTDCIATVSER